MSGHSTALFGSVHLTSHRALEVTQKALLGHLTWPRGQGQDWMSVAQDMSEQRYGVLGIQGHILEHVPS